MTTISTYRSLSAQRLSERTVELTTSLVEPRCLLKNKTDDIYLQKRMDWEGVCIVQASGVVCESSRNRTTVRCNVVSSVVTVGNVSWMLLQEGRSSKLSLTLGVLQDACTHSKPSGKRSRVDWCKWS
jgi:hypothetical protein